MVYFLLGALSGILILVILITISVGLFPVKEKKYIFEHYWLYIKPSELVKICDRYGQQGWQLVYLEKYYEKDEAMIKVCFVMRSEMK